MKFVKIGKVINTHALKGEVNIRCLMPKYERFFDANHDIYFYDSNNYTYEILTVVSSRSHKGDLLVKFKNYDYINDILFLKTQDLFQLSNNPHLVNDDEVENYIGLQVINVDDNSLIGEVIDYFITKAHGVFVIQTVIGEQKMLADVSQFIMNILWEQNTVYVKLINNW
ncbi:ribosome maturation factor RimM [Spiroplasma endosymbiont of 'Nebria riversi']|uniref:ribosome maturation factor RimM n=1 Tax=Spiroplasma endosymbiont of 'Nebria riversi' TaxID=2792084 RepID=UPI001C05A27F|nr:ribosome maturation factor RimM [Spiroplasma endosymbiont of 'Nebria riversi']